MKSLLLFLMIPTLGLSQALTEIKTTVQAEDFIKSRFRFENYPYQDFKILTNDSLTFDTFKAGDFNHDGIADLLVYGVNSIIRHNDLTTAKHDEILVILGDKKRPRKVSFPSYFRSMKPYPRVISKDGKDYIEITFKHIRKWDLSKEPVYDTVFVKHDKLIPYTREPGIEAVSSIAFKVGNCYASCPMFEFTVYSNGKVKYTGLSDVPTLGTVEKKMNAKDLAYLKTLLAFCKIKSLQNEYALKTMHHRRGFLTVTFEDGSKKDIQDYGMAGTFGLYLLFDFLVEYGES